MNFEHIKKFLAEEVDVPKTTSKTGDPVEDETENTVAVTENHDHVALHHQALQGHLRALKKGNGALARHYAKRLAYHAKYLTKVQK